MPLTRRYYNASCECCVPPAHAIICARLPLTGPECWFEHGLVSSYSMLLNGSQHNFCGRSPGPPPDNAGVMKPDPCLVRRTQDTTFGEGFDREQQQPKSRDPRRFDLYEVVSGLYFDNRSGAQWGPFGRNGARTACQGWEDSLLIHTDRKGRPKIGKKSPNYHFVGHPMQSFDTLKMLDSGASYDR